MAHLGWDEVVDPFPSTDKLITKLEHEIEEWKKEADQFREGAPIIQSIIDDLQGVIDVLKGK